MDIDIKKIAKLSKIKIDNEIAEKIKTNLTKIINSVKNLPEFDSDTDFLDSKNPMILREDIVKDKKCSREEILQNASLVHAGCVVVPKNID